MNKEVNALLKELEPLVEEKCLEIKENRKKKRGQILYVILLFGFVIVPCLLVIFNVSLMYFLISLVIFILIVILVKLPNLLNIDLKEALYE